MNQDQNNTVSDNRKSKIAKGILSLIKRIVICLILIILYVTLYNNFFLPNIDSHFYESWFLDNLISFYDFLYYSFHIFWIVLIVFVLFQPQILKSFSWLKKHSK